MAFTKHQFEIEDSLMNENPEQKLIISVSGYSQLNSFLLCLSSLPTHFFYVFSISVPEHNPDFLTVKLLSRSGPMVYYEMGKFAAYNGCTFLNNP